MESNSARLFDEPQKTVIVIQPIALSITDLDELVSHLVSGRLASRQQTSHRQLHQDEELQQLFEELDGRDAHTRGGRPYLPGLAVLARSCGHIGFSTSSDLEATLSLETVPQVLFYDAYDIFIQVLVALTDRPCASH